MTNSDKEPPLSRQGSRLAILVYQGSDPTQPYPTLVIRQSATLSPRLFALGHGRRCSAPRLDRCYVRSASPDSGDVIRFTPIWPRPRGGFRRWLWVQIPASSGARASSSANDTASSRCVRARELGRRGVEVSQKLIRSYRMIKCKPDQLFKNVVPLLSAGMPKGHSAGDHLEGDPAEPAADPDADIAGVRLLEPPARGQDAEVLVAPDQVVSNHEDRTPQVVVGVSHQRTVADDRPRRSGTATGTNRLCR